MQFGVISPSPILPRPFEERPSSFLQFGKVENKHGLLFEKIFLTFFIPISPQAE